MSAKGRVNEPVRCVKSAPRNLVYLVRTTLRSRSFLTKQETLLKKRRSTEATREAKLQAAAEAKKVRNGTETEGDGSECATH
jgi:hypothetical protein